MGIQGAARSERKWLTNHEAKGRGRHSVSGLLAKPPAKAIICRMRLPARPFEWLRRAARRRSFWLGVPLLLYLPTVTGPFAFDDLMLVLRAERYTKGESQSLGLFRFAPSDAAWQRLRDRGTFPWWAPAHLRIDFFRPLAEWSFYLDMLLFGRNAVGHRLVSLLWFAAALLCLHRLFTTASRDNTRAGVATFFFGICQTVTQPVTFICNRSDLIVVVGTALAARAYWSVTNGSRLRHAVLAGVAFAGALLSKEIAVGLAGVVFVDAFFLRRGQGSLADSRGQRRVASVIALLAAAYLAWLTVTRPWHLGLGRSDELSNISILGQAPKAIALYLATWTIGFPIGVLFRAGIGPVAAVGAAGVVVTGLLIPSLRRLARSDKAAVFFALWAVVFLGIALLTFTEARALCVASVGWAYLLAGLLAPSPGEQAPSLWLRHWLLATTGTVSLCCAVGTVVMQTRLENRLRESVETYVQACDPPLSNGDLLVVAEAPTGFELLLAPERLEFTTGLKDVGVAFLSLPGGNAQFTREDDHTVVLKAVGGDLLERRLFRLSLGQDASRKPGQVFATRRFTAEIRAVDDDSRITLLAFRFVDALDSPRLHFYPPSVADTVRRAR